MPGADGFEDLAPGPSGIIIDINNQPLPPRNSPLTGLQPQPSIRGETSKRTVTRACDACRRRKTKCDGPSMPDNVCSNCSQTQKACTYVEASKPRGPPKAYVTGLEDRLERLEALLKKLRPNVDFSDELGPPVIRDSWKAGQTVVDHSILPKRNITPSLPTIIPSLGPLQNPLIPVEPTQISIDASSPSATGIGSSTSHSTHRRRRSTHIKTESDDNGGHLSGKFDSDSEPISSSGSEVLPEISTRLERLTLRGTEDLTEDDANQLRYHGHSSEVTFAEAAKKFKERRVLEVKKSGARDRGPKQPLASSSGSPRPMHTPVQRPKYWHPPPWELTWEGVKSESTSFLSPFLANLPPSDLANSLINIYFLHINMQFPLLHRPTFERYWREGLCRKDVWFACLCFALFAVSSRWSKDSRVLHLASSSVPEDRIWHHAGLLYFNTSMEITRLRRSLFNPGCLFEIQSIFLQANYLRGTSMHPTGWLFISIGMRKCQDLGAHLRSSYNDSPTIEEEQWRRVFWLMVALDRVVSAALGRPAVVADADFDVDLPLEVDDQYWENDDGSLSFQQPPGKPSTVAFFNSWVKLSRVVAFAMKTIYAVNKSKVFIGANNSRWPEQVLKQMNEALGEFIESVPPHLRWSPHIENVVFANQSASLYLTYYLTQILIHRPFISAEPDASTQAMKSTLALNTCTTAARACARIFEVQIPKGFSSIPILINCSHICAATLLMKVWDIKSRAKNNALGATVDDKGEILDLMKDIDMFMKTLEALLPRWENVEIFLNMLRDSLPSVDKETFNVPPPFRSPPLALVHPPTPKQRNQVTPPRDVPSSFECGWQWYASASMPVTSSMQVGSGVYGDHVSCPGSRGSTLPRQQYGYGSGAYSVPPVEQDHAAFQSYYPSYSTHPRQLSQQQYQPGPQPETVPFVTAQRAGTFYHGYSGS